MKIKDSYSVFVTKNFQATKEFYIKWFSFEVYFEASYFILLAAPGDKPYFIAFMDEDHPTSPPSIPSINKESGVFLTLEVENAKSEYENLVSRGLPIDYHLNDEDWGQRRFGVIDPNGMYIDVVEQTEPVNNYWEQYLSRE